MANSTVAKIVFSTILFLSVVDIYGLVLKPSKHRATDTKLDEPEDENKNELTFNAIDIPSQFRPYDLDKDGVVTLMELAKATDTAMEDARGAFRSADSNNDYKLSYKEFLNAPWIFRADDVTDDK